MYAGQPWEKRVKTAAIVKTLGKSLLFRDLNDEDRGRIARFSREMVFEAGDLLFREGDPAENIYIVVRGMVAVEVGLLGRQRRRCATVAAARAGESVGWSAGIGSQRYMSSAYAVEKTAGAGNRSRGRTAFLRRESLIGTSRDGKTGRSGALQAVSHRRDTGQICSRRHPTT